MGSVGRPCCSQAVACWLSVCFTHMDVCSLVSALLWTLCMWLRDPVLVSRVTRRRCFLRLERALCWRSGRCLVGDAFSV